MANPQIGIMFLENEQLSNIPRSGMFETLRTTYRFYDQWHGTSNPSLPDYCAISSGSNLGNVGGGGDDPTGPGGWPNKAGGWAKDKDNIFKSIGSRGFSWKAYDQDINLGGSPGYTGYADAYPHMATRHCPAQFYSYSFAQPTDAPGVNGRFDFSGANGFNADIAASRLPDFFWVSPNGYNMGHLNSTPANTNNFLAGNNPQGDASPFLGVPNLIQHMRPGGLLLITYDNTGGSGPGTNPIYAVIVGPGVTSQTISTTYTHYNMVKGLGQVFGFADLTGTTAVSSHGGIDARYTAAVALPLPPGGTVTGDTQAPTIPTNVGAIANSPTQVTVSWTASTDNVGVTGYTVKRGGTSVGAPAASPFVNTGLTANTTYSYTVSAHDAVPNTSADSTAATVTTPNVVDGTNPTVPTNLVASNITSSTATITWTPSTDTGGSGLAGYDVFRGGVQIAQVASPTYPATNLAPSTTYSFTARARDGAGNVSAQSTAVSVTTLAIVTGGNVAFRNSTDFNSGSTSVSVNPVGAVNGDTMFAHATATGASAITPPSGWTLLGATNDSTAISTSVYSKTASSETTATWTSAGATSLTVEISYVIGSCSVRVAGATNSGGTATVTNTGAALANLQANDEVCTWISSNAGPRPYPETGCGFGFMTPHDWTSQAQVSTIESYLTRKIAIAHHQTPWDCHVGVANGDFSTATQAPKIDYNNNRITYTSWPRQLAGTNASESSWNSIFGSTDPNTVMAAIAAGTYDAIIDNNATAYKTAGLVTGAHYIIRLFWEMNGGGVIFVIGKSANQAAYVGNYMAACQRIITRTKAIAKNVSFHWNPQNFQTTAFSRDSMYWGDSYVDYVGTEVYGDTPVHMLTDTSSGNGNPSYPAIYSGYSLGSSHNKIFISGEGGVQSSGSDSADATLVQSYIDQIPTFPGYRQFTWWNGSGTGKNSVITTLGPLCTAKMKTWVASSAMSPSYNVTWKPVT